MIKTERTQSNAIIKPSTLHVAAITINNCKLVVLEELALVGEMGIVSLSVGDDVGLELVILTELLIRSSLVLFGSTVEGLGPGKVVKGGSY